MLFGLLLDLWWRHKQYNGLARPKQEHFIDKLPMIWYTIIEIPEGVLVYEIYFIR